MRTRRGWLTGKQTTQKLKQKNTVEVAKAGETPSLTGEFLGKWDYSGASKQHCSLSDLSPTDSTTKHPDACPQLVNT